MFLGTYYHTIDEKGRLAIPSKFREIITGRYENRLVMTPFKSCIFVYPLAEWEKLVEKVEQLPMFDDRKRNFRRLLYSPAIESPMDKQGRILIPQPLRNIIKLGKEVAIVGMNNMIEIWPRERWELKYQEILDELGDLSALHDLGI